MGFPITVGNKTFTSQDFEGRNYVYGYPELLKAFEGRSTASPTYLGFEIEQRILPSYGSIRIKLPSDVSVGVGQVLDLEAPDKSYMGIFIEQVQNNGEVEGKVCFLSRDLTKPHTKWKVGLAQVVQQLPVHYAGGYLEARFDNLSRSVNQVLGSGFEYFNPGSRVDGTLGGYPPNVSRDPLARVNADNSGVIQTAHLGSNITMDLEDIRIGGGFEYFVDVWIKDLSNLQLYFHPDLIVDKEGSTLKINGNPLPGSFPPSTLRRYRMRINSVTNALNFYVDGNLEFTGVPSVAPSLISFTGKMELHRVYRRLYYV